RPAVAELLELERDAGSRASRRVRDHLGPGAEACATGRQPGVRRALTQRQRQIGLRGRVVMVGRDIGTVVLPEADLKLYLDAALETRAQRRYRELRERGQEVSFEEVLETMRQRDALDQGREIAPLRPAPDAVILDTTAMDIEEVFQRVLALIEARCQETSHVAG
ncbi:MAG: (d)CMP kinase, partial [Thermoflexus sp.]